MYLTEKDAVITHGILGTFDTIEGADTAIPFDAQRDKPNGDPIHFQGAVDRSTFTLSRFYDPAVELPLLARFDRGDAMEDTVVCQHLNPEGVRIPGAKETYVGAKVTKVTRPPKNANSYTPARVSYECVWVKLA